MNDLRPSEDTDRLELPEMRRLGFFKDLPTGDGFFTEPDVEPEETLPTLAQQIIGALEALTKQQRISNLIAFEQVTGEKNRAEIRKGLGL